MSALLAPDQVRQALEAKLAAKELELPLLPRAAAMVLQLVADDGADSQQLAELIQNDMALAGHVMRVANSPTYRPVSPFVSLQQVITRLGMATIGEIALATSLNADMFKAPGYEQLLQTFWHDALLGSVLSREIARIRHANVEASFLAGLLSTIGKPAVLSAISEAGLAKPEVEQIVQEYHVRAGLLLAEAWELPPVVGSVIAYKCCESQASPFHDVVMNVVAAQMLIAENELSAAMLETLNFYADDVETLEQKRPALDDWVTVMEA